jgi:hypothetical protein
MRRTDQLQGSRHHGEAHSRAARKAATCGRHAHLGHRAHEPPADAGRPPRPTTCPTERTCRAPATARTGPGEAPADLAEDTRHRWPHQGLDPQVARPVVPSHPAPGPALPESPESTRPPAPPHPRAPPQVPGCRPGVHAPPGYRSPPTGCAHPAQDARVARPPRPRRHIDRSPTHPTCAPRRPDLPAEQRPSPGQDTPVPRAKDGTPHTPPAHIDRFSRVNRHGLSSPHLTPIRSLTGATRPPVPPHPRSPAARLAARTTRRLGPSICHAHHRNHRPCGTPRRTPTHIDRSSPHPADGPGITERPDEKSPPGLSALRGWRATL